MLDLIHLSLFSCHTSRTASLANMPTLHIIPLLKPVNVGTSNFLESVAMKIAVNFNMQKLVQSKRCKVSYNEKLYFYY